MLIWTTTPWTLPANRAVVVHPDVQYAIVDTDRGDPAVRGRPARVARAGCSNARRIVRTLPGRELKGWSSRIRSRIARAPCISPTHVSTEDGTGVVHTAPGHGAEDFAVGRAEGLEIYNPVGSGRRVPAGHAGLCGHARLGREPAHRGGSRGARALWSSATTSCTPTPLLALQEPGHLPGDRAVVPVARSREPARPRAGGDRQGALDPARRPSTASSTMVEQTARLVPLPPAGLGAWGSRRSTAGECEEPLLDVGTHPPRWPR